MPLSEFLRMARGNLDQDEQNRRPNGLPSRGGNELVELVWENGQIVMQGQSSRVTKAPSTHNLQSHTPRLPDLRIGKFDGVESIFKDMSPMVPSGGLDVTQDDEIIPWLNYPLDDGIPQEYCNDLLPEISGVTESNLHSNGNALKGSSSRARLSSPWLPQQGHISDPSLGSGVSDNTTNIPDAVFANSNSIKMERQHVEGPSSSSNSLNFSHFSRPAALIRANLSSNNGDVNDKTSLVKQINSSEKGTDIRFQSTTGCIEVDRRQPVSKPTKESTPAEQMEGLKRETNVKNQKSPIPSNGVQESEKTVEPVIASSSVGSGNSPDRASCDQMHNSKRKFRENEEFDCHSDDIGTESVSVKKASSARGGAGSKRSRAAEVHNLSERKRRDRINEKMRALQELIPNCNKVDKASMLDEAIEYLKTLQLQVQIMSMGAGLCMPHMMFPTGMQHIHPAHMPHFSPMGVGLGMGMGMGYGMGMLDMNGGAPGCPIFPVPPMHGPHFPSPMMGPTNFQRIPGPTQHVFGHPAHGLPGQPPLVPLPNRPPIGSGHFAMGVNTSTSGGQVNVPNTSVTTNSEDPMRNESSQLMQNAEVTADVLRQPAEVQENKQGTDVSASADGTPTTNATDVSRKDGCE